MFQELDKQKRCRLYQQFLVKDFTKKIAIDIVIKNSKDVLSLTYDLQDKKKNILFVYT